MRFILLLVCIIPLPLFAQIEADFESGDLGEWQFSATARWAISTDLPLNGAYSLKHVYDNMESGIDAASISIYGLRPDLDKVRWEFQLRYGFDPSSQNHWGIMLSSDKGADKGLIEDDGLNSFALGVNLKGSDDTLRIWKIKDGTYTEIINSHINWQADIGRDSIISVVATRDISGEWQLFLCDIYGTEHLVGSAYDTELLPFNYFGVRYNYTSSRDRALWIDDIKIAGHFVEDNMPPEILAGEFVSNSCLLLKLNEAPAGSWHDPGNYFLDGPGIHPSVVSLREGNIIRLDFSVSLKNKESYYLFVDSLEDICANTSRDLSCTASLNMPEWGDIIITEFMSDPSPPVELGEFEYIEIYNRSDYAFNLRSLALINGDISKVLGDFVLDVGEYIVLCDMIDTAFMAEGAKCIGLAGFQSLNNSSDYLLLCDTFNYTIHGIDYKSYWFLDEMKKGGGWSMEMIDTDYPFSGSENWVYSFNTTGGTPGMQNSANTLSPDLVPPDISTIYAPDSGTIIVKFSEPVQDLSVNSNLIVIDRINIQSVFLTDSLRREFKIVPEESLSHGEIYTALFNNIFDYGGNGLRNYYPSFGLFNKAEPGDIVINEVLFNALAPGEEYIELFNKSSLVLNAADLRLVTVNVKSSDTAKVYCVSETARCILPESYYVITKNPESVVSRYFTSNYINIYKAENMPGLADDEAELLLLNKNLSLLDKFHYKDSYHFDLISGSNGVSLERIDPEETADLASNWHSASGLSGWGTPGMPNSVSFNSDSVSEGSIYLSSRRISPDNDGYEDILKIRINQGNVTCLLNIIIYDDQGYKVCHPVKNLSSNGRSNFYWDGCDSYGSPLPTGLYIIYARSISESGRIKEWKKVCAVLRR